MGPLELGNAGIQMIIMVRIAALVMLPIKAATVFIRFSLCNLHAGIRPFWFRILV
jgi:hypothetical protein